MAEHNLKYFMRENKDEVVTVPGPDSFRDEDGNVINLEIRVLSANEIQKINNNYRKRDVAYDKKGNPLVANGEVVWKTERDSVKASAHMIVEALVYPNLKDPELMNYYHCNDITDMPSLVFSKTDEFQHVSRAVMQVCGLADTPDDKVVIEEAKNS